MASFTLENLPKENSEISTSKTLSTTGKLLIGVTGGIAISLSIICASFVSPAFRRFCLPYIPATEQQVLNVFEALKQTRGIKKGFLIDLGSGDGRIVFEASRNKYQAEGVELNPWLVAYSKLASKFNGNKNVKFYRKDLWKFPLGKYDNVVIFGVEQMMEDLKKKMLSECKDNCNIVACRFPLPQLKPEIVVGTGVDTVWLYKVTRNTSST